MIDQLIKEVETLYPDHKWLIRKLDGTDDEEKFGTDGYFVHIYKLNAENDLVESFMSSGSEVSYAFRGALALAAKGHAQADDDDKDEAVS